MRHLHSIIIVSLTWLACLTAAAKVMTVTSSHNLITGENCYITYIVEMKQQQAQKRPSIKIENALFQLYNIDAISQRGKRYYLLTYRFNSPNTGEFTIPSTEFSQDFSDPISLTVRDKKSLIKKTLTSNPINSSNNQQSFTKTFPYYTQLIASKPSLFPNEPTRLEYKIYLPKSINIAQWGLPTGPKENATAWRFETPDPRSINGDAVINGIKYQVARFHTTVSGTKTGKATLGPFKNRIVHHLSMIGRMGPFIQTQECSPLSEITQLEVLDLPPNPPSDFKGDVGNFKMSVTIETKSELTTAESIKAEVTLLGRGKFSEITPPLLTNAKHWKLISQTKKDLGEMRKNINAYAQFTYLIQPSITTPAQTPTSTPGFSFSFLDPDLKAYRTLTHPGIPIKILPFPNTPSNYSTATNNQMLGIIDSITPQKKSWYKNLPLSFIHIIPGIFSLLLLLKCLLDKRKTTQLRQSHKISQRKALHKLKSQNGDDFIKSASNYIQCWINIEKHPEFNDIQQLRDDHCYKPNQPIKLSEKRKQAIIISLKKLIIILFIFSPQLSEASPANLWKKGAFNQALTEYQSKLPSDSPDLLYNIANCYQKLNQPAKAALFYNYTLLSDPHHHHAKHNLELIHKRQNSIIPNTYIKSGSLQDWISTLSIKIYYIILSLSLWTIALSILWLKIINPKNSNTRTTITLLAILSLCSASLSGYAYIQHPDKETLTHLPIAIISQPTNLSEQPITNSPSINNSQIPIASECYILSSRGTYSYIQLADKSTGWVRTKHLMKVTSHLLIE